MTTNWVIAAPLALLLTGVALSQQPAPRPLQVPNPHYVTFPLTIDVNASADKVWARIGKFCDISEWGAPGCTLLSGDGGLGSVRSTAGAEIMVAQTPYSYTYTQPVREGAPYNLYHGTLEVRPLSASTSRIYYTFVYDNSMLADDAARNQEMTARKTRFSQWLNNMKILVEGGTLPPGALAAPATTAPAPPAR